MEYYIISLKHTSIGDTALTLWRANAAGYTWDQKSAGTYTEDEIKPYAGDYQNIPVPKAIADNYFLSAKDFGDSYVALPNDITVRRALNLSEREMKPKKYATCRMKFNHLNASGSDTGK